MIRRRLLTTVCLGAAFLVALPMCARIDASGYQSLVTLFESTSHPDLPLDKFAAGQMGIIKGTWDYSFLFVAYRYLSGRGLDLSDQNTMVSLWDDWLGLQPLSDQGVVEVALIDWYAARNHVPDVDAIDGIEIYRDGPAEYGGFSFANCNTGSFRAAKSTLDAMIAKFALASPQVKRWVDAQDQVFNNCSGKPANLANEENWGDLVDEWEHAREKIPGLPPSPSFNGDCRGRNFHKAALALDAMIAKQGASSPEVRRFVGAQDQHLVECSNAQRPTAVSTPDLPASLSDATPYERSQRNYQIAAATFYAGNYDAAAKLYEAIGADHASPWRALAPYLVARATIRKATLSGEKNDPVILAKAEGQLQHIIATSKDSSVRRSAQRLLGFVVALLHPDQQVAELSKVVLLRHPGLEFKQDVSDYIWMLDHRPPADPLKTDELTEWIETVHVAVYSPADPSLTAHAIERWKKSPSLPWLVAAIMGVAPTDPSAPALLEAAGKVKANSPAFATVSYHIARILIGQGKTEAARAKLDALLVMSNRLPLSSVNELKSLRMSTARNLAEWLADAPRKTLGFTDTGDSQDLPDNLDATPVAEKPTPTAPATPQAALPHHETGFVVPYVVLSSVPEEPTPTPTPDLWKQQLRELAAGPMFDTDASNALTFCFPLHLLIEAAKSSTLTPRLRGEVAVPAFVRAILLGDETAARALAPIAANAQPGLEPSIDQWLAVKNVADQKFTLDFMLLRNPGLRLTIAQGAGRTTPLDEVDGFRDNWWFSGNGADDQKGCPGFLTSTEKQSAVDEWKKVFAVNAPNFLCSAAIDRAKTNPTDQRVPEALYRCISAVHLGCSNKASTPLAKSAFQILHRHYPKSAWAAKAHFWYVANDCGS